MLLQGQIGLPFSIYNDITESNWTLFFDLQVFYRVKSVSLFRFTRFLQGLISLPFSLYNVITGSNRSPFFDLQCYYRVKPVSLFRFTMLNRVKSVSLSRFTMLLQDQTSLPFSIYNVITGTNQSPFFDLQCYYRVKSVRGSFVHLIFNSKLKIEDRCQFLIFHFFPSCIRDKHVS